MRLSLVVVGIALLGCSGVATEPPPPAPPAAPPPPPPPPVADEGGRLLPPLPDRGEGRPDDCLLDLDGLDPLLRFRQPGAVTEVRTERKKGALVERVEFADGTVVRVARFGCAHYGEVWELAPVSPGSDARDVAVERLGRLETKDGPPGIVDSLKRATDLGPDGAFTCGDARCSVLLDGGVVTVSYDFAL